MKQKLIIATNLQICKDQKEKKMVSVLLTADCLSPFYSFCLYFQPAKLCSLSPARPSICPNFLHFPLHFSVYCSTKFSHMEFLYIFLQLSTNRGQRRKQRTNFKVVMVAHAYIGYSLQL